MKEIVREYRDAYGNWITEYSDGSRDIFYSQSIDEVVIRGPKKQKKKTGWSNFWEEVRANSNPIWAEQARQSWNQYMPKALQTPVLQTPVLGGEFPWQDLSKLRRYNAYDGGDFSRNARMKQEFFNNDNTQYIPIPINLAKRNERGFNPKGDDAKSGDKKKGTEIKTTNPELLALSYLSDDELIYYYYHANQQAASTSFNRELNREFADKILFRFIEGKGGKFTDMPEISKELWNSPEGRKTQKKIAIEFRKQMKLNNGNFNDIFGIFNLKNIQPPNYRESDIILKAIAGGTQQLDIEMNSIKITGRFYTATITSTIWDSYGVDENDAVKKRSLLYDVSGGRIGLQAMWILQNQRGKKPLRLGYKHTFTISGIY